jgi:hypothetical protein
MFVTERDYADFVVWSNVGELYIERIHPDKEFWENALAKVTQFFRGGVLLELLAKFISRGCLKPLNNVIVNANASSTGTAILDVDLDIIDETHKWCICNGKLSDTEPMILCESEKCVVQWYHIEC